MDEKKSRVKAFARSNPFRCRAPLGIRHQQIYERELGWEKVLGIPAFFDTILFMRILALALLMSFSFQTVDVPPTSAAKNPKTCCARAICLCKHAKGAPCDYKAHKASEQVKVTAERSLDGDCPFHKGMMKSEMKASGADKAVAVRVAKLNETAAGFTQAPCHTNTPKSLLPNTVRDYEPSLSFEMSDVPSSHVWFQNDSKFYLFPGLSGPDHPPRVLFSF